MAKWRGQTNAGLWGIKLFVFVLRHVGLRFAYFILRFVAIYYFLFSFKSNKSLFYYFHNVLKFAKFNAILKIYKNYFVFGQTLLDKVALLSGAFTKFTIDHEGAENLVNLAKNGKGGILVSGHIGNWEIAGQLLNRLESPFNILVYENEHKVIKNYLTAVESKKNVSVIPIKEGEMGHIIQLHNAFSNNELVVMHGDRFRDHAATMELPFLGKMAKFPTGPFMLAARFGVPICVVFAVKETRTHYRFFATPPMGGTRSRNKEQQNIDIASMMKNYVSEFEKYVRMYPEQWFNYYPFWEEHA